MVGKKKKKSKGSDAEDERAGKKMPRKKYEAEMAGPAG